MDMNNQEVTHGGWSLVDKDGQPVTDPAALEGWSADFQTSNDGVVAVESYSKDPANPFYRTFRSKLNGSALITTTLTGPAGPDGEAGPVFTGEATINVVNSAVDKPVFTLSAPEGE